MKTLTVRLPESLVAEIDQESRERSRSKSDIVRERLQAGPRRRRRSAFDRIADLVGSVEALPADLSAKKKHHLRVTGIRGHRLGQDLQRDLASRRRVEPETLPPCRPHQVR